MADISMCQGIDCSLKEKCFRYKAIKSIRQLYFTPEIENDECLDYWPIDENMKLKLQDANE